MDIKEYLNEKLKNNKVADNLKRLTATALVAGTILTGAGLTACEQKTEIAKAFDKKISAVEDLPNDFEFDNIRLFKGKMQPTTIELVDFVETDEATIYKSCITYEISEDEFQKLYDMVSENESDPLINVNELLGNVCIDIDSKALNNQSYKQLLESIYSIIENYNGTVEDFSEESDNQQER